MIELFDKIKIRYFIVTIVMLFVCQILRFFEYCNNYDVSIVISIFGLLGLILYILDKVFTKRKIDKFDIIIYILILLGVISSIFSINFEVAIFGFKNRNEGLFVILTYYLVFLNTKSITNIKYKSIIFNMILVYGFINSLYGICQYFRYQSLLGIPVINYSFYASAFETNSNFFSTIAITSLALSLSKYLFNNKKLSFIYGILSIIYFMGILCSGAMSGALTFIIISLLLIIFLIVKIKNIKIIPTLIKIIIITICLIITFNQFNTKDHGYYKKQVSIMEGEIENVAGGNIEEKYGTGRIHIWKETLKIVPDNIITGVGIDNFYYGFKDKPLIDIKSHLKVDKAHNEYLQKLVTEGIFSIIAYLVLIFMILFTSMKIIVKDKKINSLTVSLLFGFIAYSIQGFFNISVICVAPIYYIIMGLLIGESNERN